MKEKIKALREQIDAMMDEVQAAVGAVPEAEQTKWSYYMLIDCEGKIRLASHMMGCALDSLNTANRAKAVGK